MVCMAKMGLQNSVISKLDKGSKIVDLALEVGYLLLTSGGEMERTDRTIQKVCDAYGASNIEYFTYPSFILVSLDYEGKTYTKSRRVRENKFNFSKLEKLSKTFDEIVEQKPNLDVVIYKVRMINATKPYGVLAQMLCYFLGPASFTVFFGGGIIEAIIAGVIGQIIFAMSYAVKKFTSTFFFPTTIYSFVMSFTCRILGILGIVSNVESMQIGLLMMVVPGIVITNSMREFISGEYLTGYSKLIEALLVALAVAIGVIMGATAVRLIFG